MIDTEAERALKVRVDVLPTALSADERRAAVWELRLRGYDYTQIHAELVRRYTQAALPSGYGPKQVRRDCSDILVDVRNEYAETAAEMVQIEAARFDTMLAAVWDAAVGGDGPAIDRALAISRERRKMLGLDDPDSLRVDWRIEIAHLIESGDIKPEDVAYQLGEEALIEVNRLMLEMKDD